jgi:hypothetical protein
MKPAVVRFAVLLPAFLGLRLEAQQYCEPALYYRQYLVGCNLSFDSIAQDGTGYCPWTGGYSCYSYDALIPGWTPGSISSPPPIPRGSGGVVTRTYTTNICFNEPTQALVLPLQLPVGHYVPVSCQSNVVATFEDMVGRSPVNGTYLCRQVSGSTLPTNSPAPYDYAASTNFAAYSYSNGVWSPSVPVAAIGEAVLVYQPAQFVYQPVALNPRVENAELKFEIETVYGKSVTIEYADTPDSSSWQELTTFVGDGHSTTVVDNNSTTDLLAQRFYRVRSTAP